MNQFQPVVVIPTYNHAGPLCAVLERVTALGLDCIVVNDGSTDDTAGVIDRFAEQESSGRVHAVHLEKNLGKAGAMQRGFDLARELGMTHAVTIDSDGQLDPADIPRLIEISKQSPEALVLGTRPMEIPGCPHRCMVGRRQAGLWIFAQTGRRVSDTQCGLRVYPLELVERVRCRAGRFAFEAEIITRSVWAGREVIEVPVSCTYLPDGGRTSHFRPFMDSSRQALTHAWLLARALGPGIRSVKSTPGSGDGSDDRGGSRIKKFLGWINPLRSWRDVRESDVGSLEFSAAVALGAWIGTSPFYGLHTAMALLVSWRLHLRPAAMVLGTQVSIPPVGIFLAIVSHAVGHVLLTGSLPEWGGVAWGGVEWDIASLFELTWGIFTAWLVGSVIVGFLIGLALFGGLRVVLPRVRAAKDQPGD